MKDRGTARLIKTAAGHEVIYGTTGSGKTYKAKQRIDEDFAEDRSVWIIDLDGQSLPGELDLSGAPATTLEEARDLIDAARGIGTRGLFGIRRRLRAPKHPITITIEDAFRVLADPGCRRRLEALLDVASEYQVRLRLVVQNLQMDSFGGSKRIRAALVPEGAVERALCVWDNSTPKEQREMLSFLFETVDAYTQTKQTEHLVKFAESVDLTMRLRWDPKYVDAVRASAQRNTSYEDAVDVGEMLRNLGIRT